MQLLLFVIFIATVSSAIPIDFGDMETKLGYSDVLDMAESVNEYSYVYRPLFSYRKIEHQKRRFNMYNSFAG